LRAAEIEVSCRLHVILGEDGKVGKAVQVFSEVEDERAPDAFLYPRPFFPG